MVRNAVIPWGNQLPKSHGTKPILFLLFLCLQKVFWRMVLNLLPPELLPVRRLRCNHCVICVSKRQIEITWDICVCKTTPMLSAAGKQPLVKFQLQKCTSSAFHLACVVFTLQHPTCCRHIAKMASLCNWQSSSRNQEAKNNPACKQNKTHEIPADKATKKMKHCPGTGC